MNRRPLTIAPRVAPVPRLARVRAPAGLWVGRLARFGFAAKGVVYIVIGCLAFGAAIGARRANAGSREAVSAIARQPFGELALWVVGCGLIAYAMWYFVQVVLDPEKEESGAWNAIKRGAYFVAGLVHASLGAFALQTGMGSAAAGRDDSAQQFTAQLLAQPFGQWLVGLAGVVVAVVAGVQFYNARTAKFINKLQWDVSGERRRWVEHAGRCGFFARGVVFAIVSWFLIVAAVRSDSSQAQGLGGALDELGRQSYGPWLLGGVAAGLFLYGFFMLILARYRRFPI
jgi:hypothetical protein